MSLTSTDRDASEDVAKSPEALGQPWRQGTSSWGALGRPGGPLPPPESPQQPRCRVLATRSAEYCPLVSIVIPTRNEAEDIGATLEACLRIDYEPMEVIVVDDSTDKTPETVLRFAHRGVRLIHREENRNGCCGARNVGIQSARGEIVVLLNADNRPSPDVVGRLLAHYQCGADFVVIQSEVLNRDNIWGSYLHAMSVAQSHRDPHWSEGFSCRRSAAIDAGLIPGDFAIPFCRDWTLDVQLRRKGFKKKIDLSIVMQHVVPDRLASFWRNWVWRGSMSAPLAFYMGGLSLPVVCVREVLKAIRTISWNVLLVPSLIRAIRYSRHVPGGWRGVPSLFVVGMIQDLAIMRGNLEGVVRVLRRGRSPTTTRPGSATDALSAS